MSNKDEILVKYMGRSVPFMGGKQIFPGVQGIDRKSFMDHIETPIGKSEILKGFWKIEEESKDVKGDSKTIFSKLPVVKQNELIVEMYDEKELKELLKDNKISISVKKSIKERIKELNVVEEKKESDE